MLTYVSFLAVRHYEVVYLIHEDSVDEVESVISKVQGAFWTSGFLSWFVPCISMLMGT